jgi:hypothetical protein
VRWIYGSRFPLLVYTTAEQLRQEPDIHRFWVLGILMSLRDKASRMEVRFGEGEATLYHRVQDRDWELTPVGEELFEELKPSLRKMAKLVAPERPDFTITAGPKDARMESQQVGWLTFDLDQNLIDLLVRIDPREPFGFIQIDFEYPEEMPLSGLAGQALAEYYELE